MLSGGALGLRLFAAVPLFCRPWSARRRKWLGLRRRSGRRQRICFGQEARGAHFLSHDLTSAAIAWLIAIGLYYWILGRPATIPPVS